MWLASAPDLYYPPTAQARHQYMKSMRHHFISIFTICVIFNTSTLVANEPRGKHDCVTAQKYFQLALSQRDENNVGDSFDYSQLLMAADCSVKAGNASGAITQYQFIVGLDNTATGAWSELIFLQMQEIVSTLKGLISNSPPRTEQEREIFSQMMSLVEVYGEDKASRDNQLIVESLKTATVMESSESFWKNLTMNLTWINENELAGTDSEIQYYLSDPNYFDVIGRRASRFLGYIISEIRSRNLPIELALLPIIESSLDPKAISPKRAAGLWQLMPATAKQYRLNKTRWYDERFDIRISTETALNHLEALNKKFDGNWIITLAAYNSGAARIQRLLSNKKLNNNNWIYELPNETRQYLARVFALSSILVDPKKYGVKLPQINPSDTFVVVPTNGRIELPLAAQLANMKLSTLRSYNPGYLRWAIPRRGYQELLMPPEAADLFRSKLSGISQKMRMSGETYEVAYGDTLGEIADRLQVRVSELRSINNIRRNMIQAGENLLVPGTSYQPD